MNLPANCARFSGIGHVQLFKWSTSPFPTIYQNDIQNLTADLLHEVYDNISTEPSLQLLICESLSLCTVKRDAGAFLLTWLLLMSVLT